MRRNNFKLTVLAFLLAMVMLFSACDGLTELSTGIFPNIDGDEVPGNADSSDEGSGSEDNSDGDEGTGEQSDVISLSKIPEYCGSPYVKINGNIPYFTDEEITDSAFESYGALDELGRCTFAMASVGIEIMPTEDREDLDFRPTGWHTVKYDFIDGKYLYNRCHLIGFQLTGENDNKYNLMTGTRYLNIEGMLDFENEIDDYVEETENHVMYRVTPIFVGDELVARGVLMEAYSVEDEGEGICFCVYAYNVQPGVDINYATGESKESSDGGVDDDGSADGGTLTIYFVNISTLKFHTPDCRYASSKNVREYEATYDELIDEGYSPCKVCLP